MNTEQALKKLENGDYGFVDAGCSRGGSIKFCEELFQKGKGLGIDLDPKKLDEAMAAGFDVVNTDLLTTPFPEKSVSFASMMDFLEHLPNQEIAEKILLQMARISKDFLFICHPNFDDIAYLKKFGFKLSWTDWKGHPNMMTIQDFKKLFKKLGWRDYAIIPRKQIVDSSHKSIVPLSAPRDTITYNPDIHEPKSFVKFDREICAQYYIFVKLNSKISKAEWQKIIYSWDKHPRAENNLKLRNYLKKLRNFFKN